MPNAADGAGAPGDADIAEAWVVEVGVVALGGNGLSPPPPSSVAPKGICIERNGATTMPVGEEADAAGCAKLGGVSPQFVEVGPLAIPPSNSAIEAEAPEVPVTALPGPEQAEFVGEPVIGLKPGEASSVAPRGMPGDATGAAGPMPSGEVAPSGEGVGAPTPWARAVPQATMISMADTMSNRTIIDVPLGDPSRCGSLVKMVSKRPAAARRFLKSA